MAQTPIAQAVALLGTQNALANLLGVDQTMVSQWVTGRRTVAPHHCMKIETATEGLVRCEALRPDVEWLRDAAGNVIGNVPGPAPSQKRAA